MPYSVEILLKYKNPRTSVEYSTGRASALVRHDVGKTEYLVDNLKGKNEWLPMSKAFKVSPALHQTLLDLYRERYKGCGGEKEAYKMFFWQELSQKHRRRRKSGR